jgi:ribosomal protein S18 acetylase RimI-like enzyme
VKLTDVEKTDALLETLALMSAECFKGIEQPPPGDFARMFRKGDVFLYHSGRDCLTVRTRDCQDIVGYAIMERQHVGLYLWQIAVSPNYRGRGIGSQLLDEMYGYYARHHHLVIELNVMIDNTVAQMLYLKNGYKVVSVMRGLYGPHVDGLRMRRNIP